MRRHSSLGVIARTGAATLGGYATANSAAIALAHALPGPRAEAVVSGLLASFAIYLLAILWAFGARSVARAWLGLVCAAVPMAGLAWWLAKADSP